MAKNDKGRSFYEWATLIIKLLTALAALVAAVTELLRLSSFDSKLGLKRLG